MPEHAMKKHENIPTTYAKRKPRPLVAVAKSLPLTRGLQQITVYQGPGTSIKTFVENVYLPKHVELKGAAGRKHYHSILKYILTPESVEEMFSAYGMRCGSIRKTRTDWPCLDNVRLRDLTEDRVRQLISYALSEGYSPQTLKHIRSVIGSIIKLAERERIFKRENPICNVSLPALSRRLCHELTKEQAKTILKLLRYPEREVALLTMSTGLGVHDICALRWKDVNLTPVALHENGRRIPARSIVVAKPSSYQAKGPVQRMPDKYVAISETLATALIQLRRRSEDPNDFLVTSSDSDSESQLTLKSLRLRSVSKELHMPWLSWQVLRRAHQAFIEELRIVLTDELIAFAYTRTNHELIVNSVRETLDAAHLVGGEGSPEPVVITPHFIS
jgi:integrase